LIPINIEKYMQWDVRIHLNEYNYNPYNRTYVRSRSDID
jgi:hypothetical protein